MDAKTTTSKKTAMQYRRLRRFDIMEYAGVKRLISNQSNNEVRFLATAEEFYNIIDVAHKKAGHSGSRKTKQETNKSYANITIDMVNTYMSLCEQCNLKKAAKI